ncbi:MAG: permease [Ruminococcus sp.]|nr:permease [Ruminococcus sp.]
MEENRISSGKRPKNSLSKRVFKDLHRDRKRYIMIFVMLVITIGFVSGMYVANHSMMQTLGNSKENFIREDGHFELSARIDDELISDIETGEMSDIVSIFKERAYKEAENEVKNAVDDAMTETVREEVKNAIYEQTEKAIDEQLKAAEAKGAKFTDEERQKTIDDAYQKAMDENYDKAVGDALNEAFNSEDYKKALDEAMDEAKKETDRIIDDEYAGLSERYELDDDNFKPVPVKIHELFYKQNDETVTNNSEKSTIRVFNERTEINLYDILEGRKPETENEIIIDRMHADNVNIVVGDTIFVGNTGFEVVGLAAFTDYSCLFESNTDTMFDAISFDVAMTTQEGFERIKGITHYSYAFLYENRPDDIYAEREQSDNFLKALITQTAVAEKETEIEDYVPEYANQAIQFAPDDMGSDKAMGGVLLYILTAVLAFIFAVTISTTLEKESSVIGTLRASGYTKGELIRYYMSAPVIVVIAAAVVGNILGYTCMKKVVTAMYYNSYSLPAYETIWTPEAFVKTTIIPIILMILINLFVIVRTLKLSPLQFLRHDLKKTRRKKAVRLPKWKFFGRFRMRVFLQNIPNYCMLFIGISFVMLLLSMAVGMPSTLKYYQDSISDMMFAQDQIILSDTKDRDSNVIVTETDGAEPFSVTSLERKSDTYNEEITVYGIIENSSYIKLNDKTDIGENAVYISQAYSEKYDVHKGDTITLSEKYEHKDYTWEVYDIYPYTAGIAVFMTNSRFNSVFDKDADSFSGYISDKMITDIDEDYIAKEITLNDMTKLTRQLDHSMGSYMLYFQYVCMIVAAIILYLLTKIIIEKNERSISMVKILGYDDREISSLYLITTGIVVFITEFIAIYIGYLLMSFFWKYMMMTLGGWFAFVMKPSGFVKEFLLVFAAYLIITVIDFVRIKHIPKVLALKNVE